MQCHRISVPCDPFSLSVMVPMQRRGRVAYKHGTFANPQNYTSLHAGRFLFDGPVIISRIRQLVC